MPTFHEMFVIEFSRPPVLGAIRRSLHRLGMCPGQMSVQLEREKGLGLGRGPAARVAASVGPLRELFNRHLFPGILEVARNNLCRTSCPTHAYNLIPLSTRLPPHLFSCPSVAFSYP